MKHHSFIRRCFLTSTQLSIFTSLLFFSGCASPQLHEKEIKEALLTLPTTQLSPVDFAVKEMTDAGINTEFAQKVETYYLHDPKAAENRDRVVQLNVLGFLSPGDYSRHYSEHAVKEIQKFLKKYKATIKKMELQYDVSGSIVASLLWVETKHGKTMGDFELPVIYFTLLQANHPDVARNTLMELNRRKPAPNSNAINLTPQELHQKAIRRSISKSKWALDQLRALEEISQKQKRGSKSILSIRSSFAGAFGCSQFIPTSYQKYAVSSQNGKTPNLFDLKDCIMSVGNFLHLNGWDPQITKAQSDALFVYNRIRDYGNVIQKLAEAAQKSPQ